MHQSGTSAFAHVLNLLGCDLPRSVMQPNEKEEAGSRDPDALHQFNDRILASAGSRWDDWLEFNTGWLQSPRAEEFREEALELVREEFGASRLFVLEDPRICRLVPFWLGVLEEAGVRPLILSAVRNPLQVAASLEGRHGLEAGLSHLLWLRHVLDAEFASRGMTRFFTSYDRLTGGWARTAADAESTLGIAWPRLSEKVAVEIESFLSDYHRHYQQPVEAGLDNPTLSDWLRGSFEILGRWSAAGEDRQDFAALDRFRAALNAAAPAFSRVLRAEQQKAARLELELGTERQRLGESEQQMSQLKSELESRAHVAEEAEKSLVELRNRLAQTESALAQRSHEAEQTAGELAATREQLRQATAARAEAERVSAGLKEHLAVLMADLKERQAAYAAEQQTRATESAETDRVIAGLASQVKQVLAVLDTSRHELAARLSEAEQGLKQRTDEIEALRRVAEEKQSEIHHERSEAERLRQVAAAEIGRAAGLLNGDSSPSYWRRFHLRRQAARLKRSGLFDAEWYLREYADVAKSGMDPLRHYIEFGAKEGRAPNPALTKQIGKA
jgi:hypothetical protein